MMELRNCFIPIVSLYCHNDEDCVITDNNITDGYWMIGAKPADDKGGVVTANEARDQWPHQVRAWKYDGVDGKWLSDPQLTVTGNMNINIFCLLILLFLYFDFFKRFCPKLFLMMAEV